MMHQDPSSRRPHGGPSRTAAESPDELVTLIIRLAQTLSHRLAERCSDHGLNESRFAVLQAISASHDEGCTQTHIASQLALSESNVCALVERMRTAGLLFRFRSKTDRRCSVLRLTDEGRELVALLQVERASEAEALLAVLSPDRQRSLYQLIEALVLRLEAESAQGASALFGPVAEPAPRRAS